MGLLADDAEASARCQLQNATLNKYSLCISPHYCKAAIKMFRVFKTQTYHQTKLEHLNSSEKHKCLSKLTPLYSKVASLKFINISLPD